jgi:hypothetical protein
LHFRICFSFFTVQTLSPQRGENHKKSKKAAAIQQEWRSCPYFQRNKKL